MSSNNPAKLQALALASLNPADLLNYKEQVTQAIAVAQYRDRGRISRQWAEIQQRAASGREWQPLAGRLLEGLLLSCERSSRRAAMRPVISYPAALPLSAHVQVLRDTIARHQVVVVAGETGSGKTTQLPKICLELERGIAGRIGHTQPRRLAARTVAARIADELGGQVGDLVGFQHRFSEQFSEATRVKVMTDGVLLASLHRDRNLREYDTIIIDEAHERSLNIDFLLGVLKKLLLKRPELKLIITSATIDVERFAAYFGGAPVIEIPGRSYPVTIEYPGADELSGTSGQAGVATASMSTTDAVLGDLNSRILAALAQIELLPASATTSARDVLVFLPGEREIRDASKALRANTHRYEVLPLYGRLSVAEQQRIFSTRKGGSENVARRVVLATNVAETSVTVPGIGYVVDSGLARVSRYSARSKLQRLQVEPVSQASASQRAGRSGRIAPGVCYRLYGEDDFEQRPPYTEPEILRTQLAAVILQMKRLELGDIERFPFLEAPAPQQVSAGQKTLLELGAITPDGELTAVGKQLAGLPIDPRLGRMLLAGIAKRCVAEMLVIVSALAVQDPREMPASKREAAQSSHNRFSHKGSDFISWLKLWDYHEDLRQQLSQRQLRKRCEKEFLSYVRLREWRDMHRQLRLALRSLLRQQQVAFSSSINWLTAADKEIPYEQIHRAILTGIPMQLGTLDEQHGAKPASREKNSRSSRPTKRYRGPRNLNFYLFPGSSQFKRAPRWVMAGEIVETSRVYARSVAEIEPGWIAAELPHLVKYEYGEPYWHRRRGQVVARRNTLFFGLALRSAELVGYAKIDSAIAREVFIQAALVERQLDPDAELMKRAGFWSDNLSVLESVRAKEAKLRRRDLSLDDAALHAFYARNLPVGITSRAALAKWLRHCPEEAANALKLTEQEAQSRAAPIELLEQYPSQLELGGHSFRLSYCFAPGSETDGITACVPQVAVGALPLAAFEWLVPGMLIDKCTELIKLLPKLQRKKLVPAARVAEEMCARIQLRDCLEQSRSLYVELAEQARQHYGVLIDPVEWRALARAKLDNFYRLRIEILSPAGKPGFAGRNLPELQRECLQKLEQQAADSEQAAASTATVTSWSFGTLNQEGDAGYRTIKQTAAGLVVGLSPSAEDADAQTQQNLPQLAMYVMKDKVRYLKKNLCKNASKILPYIQIGDRQQLVDDLIKAAVAHCCFDEFAGEMPRNEADFKRCVENGRAQVIEVAVAIEQQVYALLAYYQQVCAQLHKMRSHFPLQCEDIDQQMADLVCPGFLQRTGVTQLEHVPRYLEAILVRLDRLGGRVDRDVELCEKLSSLQRPLHNLLYKYPHAIVYDEQVRQFRWLLEELRVSLFAQHLKTVVPVSTQRVLKAWQAIDLNQYPLAH